MPAKELFIEVLHIKIFYYKPTVLSTKLRYKHDKIKQKQRWVIYGEQKQGKQLRY